MECRVCRQPISFLKAASAGQKRSTVKAVHESDLAGMMTQAPGEVVRPHPGTQRKLRLQLEKGHGGGEEQMAERSAPAATAGRPDLSTNQHWAPAPEASGESDRQLAEEAAGNQRPEPRASIANA